MSCVNTQSNINETFIIEPIIGNISDFLPLSGGTVTGDTIFTSGLTANTIYATTYLNLPVTENTYTTGFTYNDNTFTIFDNSGSTFNAIINSVTGLTVNGGLSATTISGETLYGDGSNLTNIQNIYNSDGILTGNRTLNGANNNLFFTNINDFLIQKISKFNFYVNENNFNLSSGNLNDGLNYSNNNFVTGGRLLTIGKYQGASPFINLKLDMTNSIAGFSDGRDDTAWNYKGLKLDFANSTYSLGDFNNTSGSTKIIIDDTAQTISLSNISAGTDSNVLTIDNQGVVHSFPLSGLTGGTAASGDYLPLSGGTVTGETIFQSGLTANTISATTIIVGDIAVGTSGATNKLHVSASTNPVRFEGLQSGTTDTRILTSDSNGVIKYNNLNNIRYNYFISGSTPTGVTINYGDRWYNTNNGIELVYITDGNSNQWVQPANTPGPPGYSSGLTNTNNIYNNDGVLQSNRVVDLSSYTLNFSSSTNPNTLVLNSSNIGIGTTTPITPLHISNTGLTVSTSLISPFAGADILTISTQNTAPGLNIISASDTQGHRGVFKATRARGTLSSPTVPSTGDDTFSLLGAIYDGVTNLATAGITMEVDGVVTANTAPQRIIFETGTGSTRTERMRITSGGNVGVGTTNPTAFFHVNSPSIPATNETITRFTVGDAPNAYLDLRNGTLVDGQFVAQMIGRQVSGNSQPAFYVDGAIESVEDVGLTPITIFRAFKVSGSTLSPLSNRTLFDFRNWTDSVMTIDAIGEVGIGITTPTAKLHVNNTGTTNSFLVEDSANPDSSPFVIDASGKVGVGVFPSNWLFEVSGTGKVSKIGNLEILSNADASNTGQGIRIDGTDREFIFEGSGANTAINMFSFRSWVSTSAIASISNVDKGFIRLYGGFTNPNIDNLSGNELWITPTYNITTTAFTTTIRGIYYNPVISSLTNTTHIAYENTTGNNILNSVSGNTLIGTKTDIDYKLNINGITNGVNITLPKNSAYNGLQIKNSSNETLLEVNGLGTTTIGYGSSNVTINGGTTQINTNGSSNARILTVNGSGFSSGLKFTGSYGTSNTLSIGAGVNAKQGIYYHPTSNFGIFKGDFEDTTSATLICTPNNNVLIGTTIDNAYKLDVSGTTRFSNTVQLDTVNSSSTDTKILTLSNGNVIQYRNLSSVSAYSTTGITASSQTLTMSFNYYGVNYNGNVDLTLPNPSGYDGYNFTIKDEGGYAATHRIRLIPSSGLIDGNNYVDINLRYVALHLMARDNNWWII